jgi:cytoskeletal protein CcmA (bactofilin family)
MLTDDNQNKSAVIFITILVLALSLIFIPQPCTALVSTSNSGIDSLPDKIFDDLVISDKHEISKKLNEISGDLILSAEKVNVKVTIVKGNINAIGSKIYIGGRILQSVRLLGNHISTDARIDRNLTIAAYPPKSIVGFKSHVEILRDCVIGKDVDISASEIFINGEIEGNLRADGENIILQGVIFGDVKIEASQKLVLEPSCKIEGTLEYSAPREAEISEGAQVVSGNIVYQKTRSRGFLDISLTWRLILGFGSLLVGLIFSLICSGKALLLTTIMGNHFGKSIGIGAVSMIGMFLYTSLFAITFIFAVFYKPVFTLVPVMAIAFIGLLLMFYLASILVAIFVGRLIISRLANNKNCSPSRSLVLGLVILVPIFAIPYIGIILHLIAAALGFGTFSIAIYRQFKTE